MAHRRAFLAGLLATGLAPRTSWADVGNPAFLSAGRRGNGTYVLCGLTSNGAIAFEIPLPARGHAAAAHPIRAEAVAFARRPGTFAIVIDCVSGAPLSSLNAPEGRHFYGHGAFSRDGTLLFTTENDFDAARGRVGVWDVSQGYRRIAEFASGGVGPHDIKRLPGKDIFVIANGGIETHPDAGRTKLNLPTMRPNLTYLTRDGEPLAHVELDPLLRKNSIRHLAVARDGTVAFAMQWQGDQAEHPALLGLHQLGASLVLCETDRAAAVVMNGYAGSVAVLDTLGQAAITSPRGGVCQVFDMRSGQLVSATPLSDVCGASPGPKAFTVTNGNGLVGRLTSTGFEQTARHAIQWDNHLIPVAGTSL